MKTIDNLMADNKGAKNMLKGKWFLAGLILIVFLLIVVGAVSFSNIKYAQEGTVQVVTRWGAIERICEPADGWFTTIAPGRKSYEVNVKSFTESAPVRVTSKIMRRCRLRFQSPLTRIQAE